MEYLHPILRDDAQPETHPMTLYVEDPHGIEEMFGDISYSKGNAIFRAICTPKKHKLNIEYLIKLNCIFTAASVIRMFMFAIGEETFKKSLNYYLTNK